MTKAAKPPAVPLDLQCKAIAPLVIRGRVSGRVRCALLVGHDRSVDRSTKHRVVLQWGDDEALAME